MRIKMLRSQARRPDRVEGAVIDVPDDEGQELLKAALAEKADPPEPAKKTDKK